ncbi:MAG: phenylalanine--tRNA ligase subunit alpha [Patescibacteria group bacterium]|nr:phenylalanine--tRNA ligase subunit alpha [Patescibacteria group bacterium]
MIEQLEAIKNKTLTAVADASDVAALAELEIAALGRKSEFMSALKGLGALPPEERKAVGERVNAIKRELETAFAARRADLQTSAFAALAETEWLDVTMPGTKPPEGHIHLVNQAIRDITEIFSRIGFYRVRAPEVDWDWYAFESLNMPSDHPARDEWETFFMDAPENDKQGKMVLTPHTSNGQVREMERRKPPIRMIGIGKCYRRQIDVSHVPMFHQFEGLMIDKNVSVTHLRGVLDYFAQNYFGPDRKTRLRPFHFRFTEPSFEVDITCGVCHGTGKLGDGAKPAVSESAEGHESAPSGSRGVERCRLCKDGWVELGGAGMVHPNVLKAGGLDPEEWGGFAFGWGVERTMMMRTGLRIPDIREIYSGDFRFLKQF